MSGQCQLRLSALLAALFWATYGEAQSSFWDRVEDPAVRVNERRWVKAQRDQVAADAFLDPQAVALSAARTLLRYQVADGKPLDDPSLSFLLGKSLVLAGSEYQEQGRRVLLSALKRFPNAPEARGVWLEVGLVSAQLGDLSGAQAALSQSLAVEWEPERRIRALLERAAVSVRQQDLDKAIGDYRVALQESRSETDLAHSRWGLGVALDRNYDFPAALPYLVQAASSKGSQWPLGNDETLPASPLLPPYEIYYYRALGQMAIATEQAGSALETSSLQAAELMWLSYVQAAPDDDPWLLRARQHLKIVRRKLTRLTPEEEEEDDDGDVDLEWMR